MLRSTRIAIAEKWDEYAHWITLALVGSAILLSFFGTKLVQAATIVDKTLYYGELAALGIAVLHILVFYSFKRNIAREIAAALSPHLGKVPAQAPASNEPYSPLPPDSKDIHFALSTDNSLETVAALNQRGYARTSFEMTKDQIASRNASLFAKNPKVFMLVRNPTRETEKDIEFIGYTCVLPLNSVGADCYLNSLIKDRDVRASMICDPTEQCTDLLLFAVALKDVFAGTKKVAQSYYPFLFRCAAHHVGVVAQAHREKDSPQTVWIQAEHKSLGPELTKRGYKETVKKSADGFILYSRSL